MYSAKEVVEELVDHRNLQPMKEYIASGRDITELTKIAVIYHRTAILTDLEMAKMLFERGMKIDNRVSFFSGAHDPEIMSDEVFDWAIEQKKLLKSCTIPLVHLIGNGDRFRKMLAKGLDIYKENKGFTVMHIALILGIEEDVRFLVDFGYDIHRADKQGRSCIHHAMTPFIKTSMVDLLLKLGADVSQVDFAERTAPMILADITRTESVDFMQGLVRKIRYLYTVFPAFKDCRDLKGRSAIHYAVQQCHHELVGPLLGYGEDPVAPDCFGQKPIDIVLANDDVDCLRAMYPFLCEETRKKLLADATLLKRTKIELFMIEEQQK